MKEEETKTQEQENEKLNNEQTNENTAENENATENQKNEEKTFSKSDVEKAKNESVNALYKELGISPDDKKTISMFKAFVASQKTDETNSGTKEDEDKKRIEEAESKLAIAEAKAEAMTMGVQAQFVDDVVTLAINKINSQDDADLKSTLAELKKKYPVWFVPEDNNKNSTKRGTGSTIVNNKSNTSDDDKKGLGARLAAMRKTNSDKKSYWK